MEGSVWLEDGWVGGGVMGSVGEEPGGGIYTKHQKNPPETKKIII